MRKLPQLDNRPASTTVNGKVGDAIKHESAYRHVSGEAIYIDDRPEAANLLHCAIGKSQIAHGYIKQIDLSAVREAEGVIAVITADDVPGEIDIGPVFPGDPVLVKKHVEYLGQPVFAVAATSHKQALHAAQLADITYEPLPPVLDIHTALQKKNFVRPPHTIKKGDPASAIKQAPLTLEGKLSIGAQEHFYLEGQIASAEPNEDGGMTIYTSSQHPSEVQKLVAKVLGTAINQITADTRRMGGGFGGKETQAAQWACIAALLAHKTGQPVKLRLNRQDDMIMTGKRHPFENHYRVGFDAQGHIKGVEITLNANCGYSPDLSDAVVDRSMFLSDNAYFLEHVSITGNRCKTNMVSHTAFRGFGGPQGVLTIECIIEDIAYTLGKDPLDVRKINFYGDAPRNLTPYRQTIEHFTIPRIIEELEQSAEYHQRRETLRSFNQNSPIIKKGLALTPVNYGISFTVQHLNQAGALIHVYTDGSIHLNHGGTEMGQGLYTKVAQIVANEFQVDISTIAVSAARTDKVPNTSPTAASSGTDLNGKAAQNAAQKIKKRLSQFIAEHFSVCIDDIEFKNGEVIFNHQTMQFAELVQLAYINRISLSATGYYRTPKIHYDRKTATGRPFFYYANGAAVSEVAVDMLTGEYKTLRVDILHDAGNSINPALDIGQIEGGFVQGMGWLTTEEVTWGNEGQLLTTGPAVYKIPAASDMPVEFRTALLTQQPNKEETIYYSKAVGEPPLMLAVSVWSAIRDAISSLADYKINPKLNTPATPERVLNAINTVQKAVNTQSESERTAQPAID